MNPIDLSLLNLLSPYTVAFYGDEYSFRTDYDIEYAVEFRNEPSFGNMCDNANDQQAQRNRLFLNWFRGAEQSKHFFIKTAQVMDEGMENFIAIIVPRHHPYLNEIIAYFDAEIAMFHANKP